MSNWKIIVPEATTNLVTNPSFETNTTGWTVPGSNTIAQSSTESLFGSYSALVTYQDDQYLATYGATLTAVAHTFSCWVYLSSNWDGGAVSLTYLGFTSAVTNTASTTTTTTGKWIQLQITFTPDAGDLSGFLWLYTASAPTAGRTIYVDAVQCEAKAYSTTYCDGDQDGCKWSGTKHGSTSTREALSRAGGRVKDLDDDYGFPVQRMIGAGFPAIDNIVTERAFTPGSDYQRFVVPERTMTLVSTVIGSTLADYHDKRQELIKILAPDGVPDEAPFILRYIGATITKEIKARYNGGLTLSGPEGYAEEVGLQFLAADEPLFKQIGESSTFIRETGDGWTTLSARYVARREDGIWDNMNQDNTTTGPVYASAVGLDGKVYFGGNFTNMDNIANADYIASYDDTSWAALSTGMDAAVYALKIKPNGNLLAGGAFTTAGGVTCRGIAEWNGSSWAAIGPPTTGGTVYAIELDNNGDIYVGGSFTSFDGANQNYLAKYDISAGTWGAVSTGIAGGTPIVRALALDRGGNLYVGGEYTTAGGVAADSLASWNGTAFTSLSTSTDDVIRALYVDSSDVLYIGGQFITIGNESFNYFTTWNGSSFDGLGADLSNNEYVYTITEWQDFILVGGRVQNVGGLGTQSQWWAWWTGSNWIYPDYYMNNYCNTIAVKNDDILYIGLEGWDAAGQAGDSDTITPGGTAKTYPKIIMKRTDSSNTAALFMKRIGNETTKKYLYLDYDFLAGEEVTIDLNPNNVNAISSYHGSVWPFLPGSDLSDFYLLPNTANTITHHWSRTSPANFEIKVIWRDCYWSVD